MWRYETKLFIVSMVLSLTKVVIDMVSLFFGDKEEIIQKYIRQPIIIVVMLCCTLLPHYHWDTAYDIIISISMVILYF